MLMHKQFIQTSFCFLLLLAVKNISAQPTQNHSPKFAGIASAILPGSGQVYNKKYWKVPFVYGGLGTAAYFIYYNSTVYSNFKRAYDLTQDADPNNDMTSFNVWQIRNTGTIYLEAYNIDQLSQIENIYRRYLDLSVIAATAVYGLNIVDAVVDAHLFYFDVSDDLSLQWQPTFISNGNKTIAGLNMNLKF